MRQKRRRIFVETNVGNSPSRSTPIPARYVRSTLCGSKKGLVHSWWNPIHCLGCTGQCNIVMGFVIRYKRDIKVGTGVIPEKAHTMNRNKEHTDKAATVQYESIAGHPEITLFHVSAEILETCSPRYKIPIDVYCVSSQSLKEATTIHQWHQKRIVRTCRK